MFKSDWLRGLRAILGPFTCLSATRRHNVRSRALRSVQSLEPRDLLTVSLALSAVAVSESDDAATRVITLTAESDVPVAQDGTVEISVAGLTASDYSLSDLIIVIPAGQQQGSATLTLSDDELVELAKIPNVVAIKDGTRDMAKYERNIRHLRANEPEVAILTCHDEYLLTTLVQGIDGALVGFAGCVPELISSLVQTALADRLTEAREISDSVYVLKQAVYRMGEPSADAHQRMKTAVWLMGQISPPVVRPPMAPLTPDVVDSIRRDLGKVGMLAGATA